MSSQQSTPFYGLRRKVQGASETRSMPSVAQKTKQPTYTWWPWRAVAMAVPVLAAGAGVFVANMDEMQNRRDALEKAVLTAMTIYGAGSGFLLGAAIGDFGRSILAMLAGAVAALAFSPLYDGPGLLLAAPGVVCAMIATLALHWTMQGILDAVLTGLGALFYGVLAGAGVGLVAAVLGALTLAAIGNIAELEFTVAVAGVAATLGVGNMVFIGRIFRACYRVQAG